MRGRLRGREGSRLSKFLFSLAAAGASDASTTSSSDKDLGIGERTHHRVTEFFQLSTGLTKKFDDSKEFLKSL